jgi:DNA-binding transcriptional MerR regulator
LGVQLLSIGELAGASRVKVPTIRYYESVGLLACPQRTAGRQRRYDQREVRRLSFIRHARELGFGLESIRALLALQDEPGRSCKAVDAIARQRVVEIEARIASLRALRRELKRMSEQCGMGTVGDCRIIEALSLDA